MRALRYDGRADRIVKPAAWISFSPRGEEVLAACSRCQGEERVAVVAGGKRDAERALGRFALWHAKCRERADVELGSFEKRDPRPASYFAAFRRRA